jgi:hypothetical protein
MDRANKAEVRLTPEGKEQRRSSSAGFLSSLRSGRRPSFTSSGFWSRGNSASPRRSSPLREDSSSNSSDEGSSNTSHESSMLQLVGQLNKLIREEKRKLATPNIDDNDFQDSYISLLVINITCSLLEDKDSYSMLLEKIEDGSLSTFLERYQHSAYEQIRRFCREIHEQLNFKEATLVESRCSYHKDNDTNSLKDDTLLGSASDYSDEEADENIDSTQNVHRRAVFSSKN